MLGRDPQEGKKSMSDFQLTTYGTVSCPTVKTTHNQGQKPTVHERARKDAAPVTHQNTNGVLRHGGMMLP